MTKSVSNACSNSSNGLVYWYVTCFLNKIKERRRFIAQIVWAICSGSPPARTLCFCHLCRQKLSQMIFDHLVSHSLSFIAHMPTWWNMIYSLERTGRRKQQEGAEKVHDIDYISKLHSSETSVLHPWYCSEPKTENTGLWEQTERIRCCNFTDF